MIRKVKQSRRLAPIWDAPLAPPRNGCAKTSGSTTGPTPCRRLLNRSRSMIASNTTTTGARAALAADAHRYPLDRIPKSEPASQAA
jgi:hypothetical protein